MECGRYVTHTVDTVPFATLDEIIVDEAAPLDRAERIHA